jgi:hypothetical protein
MRRKLFYSISAVGLVFLALAIASAQRQTRIAANIDGE